jgi:hypothetical protein
MVCIKIKSAKNPYPNPILYLTLNPYRYRYIILKELVCIPVPVSNKSKSQQKTFGLATPVCQTMFKIKYKQNICLALTKWKNNVDLIN